MIQGGNSISSDNNIRSNLFWLVRYSQAGHTCWIRKWKRRWHPCQRCWWDQLTSCSKWRLRTRSVSRCGSGGELCDVPWLPVIVLYYIYSPKALISLIIIKTIKIWFGSQSIDSSFKKICLLFLTLSDDLPIHCSMKTFYFKTKNVVNVIFWNQIQ